MVVVKKLKCNPNLIKIKIQESVFVIFVVFFNVTSVLAVLVVGILFLQL